MTLIDHLKSICAPMPPGASVLLPVDWVRAALNEEMTEPEVAWTERPQADLTVKEVATIERKAASTVRDWIRKGLNGIRLDAYKFSSKEYRVTHAALYEFREAQRSRTTQSRASEGGTREVDLTKWRRRTGPRRAAP